MNFEIEHTYKGVSGVFRVLKILSLKNCKILTLFVIYCILYTGGLNLGPKTFLGLKAPFFFKNIENFSN